MKKLIIGLIAIASSNIGLSQCPQASFTSTAPACQNDAIDFTNTTIGATGGGIWSYFWDFDYPNGNSTNPFNTTTNENPTGVDYSPGGNGTYTVAFTISNGTCSSTVLQDVYIRRAKANFVTSTNSACVNEQVTFYNQGIMNSSPNATVTHSWSFGIDATPSTSTLAVPPVVTYSTPGAKIITHIVDVQFLSCGSNRSDAVTQTVIINETPSVSFTSTAPVCEGSNVNFTYTGTTSTVDQYNWDFGNNSSPSASTAVNPSNITYNSFGTKSVSLTVTNEFGCFSTGSQNISINQTPVADFTTTTPVCTGLGANFDNMGTTGASYSWSFGTGSSPLTSVSENPANVIYSSAGNKIVTLTTTLGSCSSTTTQGITIHQTPSVSFSSNAPQCVGSGVNLSNTGSTGSNWSYVWDLGMDAQPSSSNSENPMGILYTSGGSKTITFTISDQFCTSTNTQSFNINSLPVMNAGADTTICANTSVQIGTTSTTGITYQWFPSNSVVISNASISNPTVSPIANTSEFIVLGTDGNSCSNTDTVIVTMLNPLVADAGVDVEICRYDSIQVGAGFIEGQLYSWSSTSGLVDSVASNTLVSPDSTITYTLSVTDDYGCATEVDQVTVIVNQLPIANAGIDDSTTVNSSVQLVATGGVQYAWWPEMGLSNAGINNPLAIPDSTTEYVVTVIDIYGCIQTDTMTVTVITPSFWLPNAFTPDDDLINDVFYVRGDGVTDFQFLVFDQWGHLIFKSKDMTIGWDGSYATGEKLPKGAYVYHVSGTLTDGTLVNSNGLVNLIR